MFQRDRVLVGVNQKSENARLQHTYSGISYSEPTSVSRNSVSLRKYPLKIIFMNCYLPNEHRWF
jgi:hypothetical protein